MIMFRLHVTLGTSSLDISFGRNPLDSTDERPDNFVFGDPEEYPLVADDNSNPGNYVVANSLYRRCWPYGFGLDTFETARRHCLEASELDTKGL